VFNKIFILYIYTCIVYIESTHYDLHVGKKKNDHDETDYLTSFHLSGSSISLSIVFLIVELLKHESLYNYTSGTGTSFKVDA